ncbi:MAG: ABC transporter permease [Bacteroidota bacterium]
MKQPPSWSLKFFRWFCLPDMVEDIEGDLVERYQAKIASMGSTKANRYFNRQVLLLFRPGIVDYRKFFFIKIRLAMLKKYVQLAGRQLLNAKNYSLINIFGLAVGIAACLVILLYINEEWSYDKFHKNEDSIYRVTTLETEDNGIVRHLANAYPPLAPLLASSYPEVEQTCRYFPLSVSVKNPESNLLTQEGSFFFADSTFFDMFSFDFQQGVEATALDQPNAIVLTQKTAKKYFKDEDPMGKTLTIEGNIPVQVTGVLEDIPDNSSLQFEFIAAMPLVRQVIGDWVLDPRQGWYYPPMYTFVKIPNKADATRIAAGMSEFSKNNLSERLAQQKSFTMQALSQVHFETLEGDLEPATDPSVLYILLAVAFLILAIGCTNYINLSLSKGIQRFKEIGMRKVLGAGNQDILAQLSVESFTYLTIALVLALIIVQITLPGFNNIMGRELSLWSNTNWYLALGTLGVLGVIGLLNAFFPFLAVSKFKLINTIKSNKNPSNGNEGKTFLKNGFVIFQFVTAIVLLIATFTIQQQLSYIQQKNLGLQAEQVIIVPIRDDSIQNKFATAKDIFLSVPAVKSVSAISNFPWERGYYNFMSTFNGQGRTVKADLQTLLVEEDFINTMNMEMIQGRPFSKDYGTSKDAFIINEAAAKKFGIKSIEGIQVNMANVASGKPKTGEVIGIVRDFHLKSLHHEMEPVILTVAPKSYFLDNFVISLNTQDLDKNIAQISSIWQSRLSDRPFDYFFLDDAFQKFYLKESRLAKVFSYFAILAFIIAGLGMFALAAYLSERRMKEMSIRKILGATGVQILSLLSKDFLKLVLIAIIIAIPLAWLSMNEWLSDFAFRTALQWWIFVGAGLFTLAIAFGTISIRGWRVVRANPVESIMQE